MAEKNRRRLDVLAYRCTPELLSGAAVHVREFSESVRSLWRLLERNYQNRMGREEVQAPYSVAINALRCLTGGYAYFDPERLFLVTRDPVDDDLLCDAFTLMSRLAADEEIDDIDLGTPTPLAERIAGTPQQQRLLAEYLRKTEAGQPDAAPWIYRSATWDLSRRLTQGSWTVDGLNITLRPDSEGGFIAWDQPWSSRNGTAHSLARCRMVMKTIPNIAEIYVIPIAQTVDSRALAKITARLCHQPLAWTGRTRYPVHLRAAEQMDLDHPQYRRSALGEDPEADSAGEPPIRDTTKEEE